MTEIITHTVVGVIGFIIGIFVYRNNVDEFDPMADKIDEKFDELKQEIKDKKK